MPARRVRCRPCATISRSTGWGWHGGSSIRTTRCSSRGLRSTASGNRSSDAGSSRRARTSAPRAHRPRIRSCSTGWPRVRRQEMEPEGAAPDDRSVGHLSPVVRCSGCPCRARSLQPAVRSRPRVRLEAEMIRDVMLSVSGLLSEKMLDPSVFPLQPDGIWNMPCTRTNGPSRRARIGSGAVSTLLASDVAVPELHDVRRATSREFCTVRRVARTRHCRR